MIRVFPVAAEGNPSYSDDFGVPSKTGPGKHQGIDIFAAEGTPVLAVDDGAVRFAEEGTGGNAVYLRAPDGTVYYGAHLSSFEGEARQVVAGEILGYVGHTGNAAGTSSHLHFEVHPNGGPNVVDPFRLLQTVTPPSVVSSLGAIGQALPAADPEAPLPPITVVPGQVAPIPSSSNSSSSSRGAGAVVAVLATAATLAAVVGSSRRRAYA